MMTQLNNMVEDKIKNLESQIEAANKSEDGNDKFAIFESDTLNPLKSQVQDIQMDIT